MITRRSEWAICLSFARSRADVEIEWLVCKKKGRRRSKWLSARCSARAEQCPYRSHVANDLVGRRVHAVVDTAVDGGAVIIRCRIAINKVWRCLDLKDGEEKPRESEQVEGEWGVKWGSEGNTRRTNGKRK